MTATERVRGAQRWLAVLAVVRATCWAGAAGLGVLAVGALLGGLVALPAAVHASLWWLAAAAALGTLGVIAWQERFVWSFSRVALWLEERVPTLRYALVTAIDPRYAATLGPQLAPVIEQVSTQPLVRHAARRSVLPAVLAFAATGLGFTAIPNAWMERITGAGPLGGRRGDIPAASRLTPLRGTVTPPRYAAESGVAVQRLDDPATIAGLSGSQVELSGPGAPDGITATAGDAPLAISASGDRWTATFTLPDSAMALRLADREFRRLIVLAPVPDQAPTAQLLLPARDTTVRTPTGSIPLDAQFGDDLGLGAARFEYTITSGETEGSFKSRSGTLGARTFQRTKEGRIQLTIPLSTFKLGSGDQLYLRAIVVDNNTLTGPDTGYSETRMLRVARAGEYDSLAVEGAPPAADTALMTLRYLIQLTERLEKQRKTLPRPQFVSKSQDLSSRVDRLRARVEELQAERTFGGMFPPNPLLSAAYLALAEGGATLGIAEPGEALPHLWDAYRALQKFARAERYYLRGTLPEVLVNLTRVRLTGKDTGRATPRLPRVTADSARDRLRRGYDDVMRVTRAAPDSATDKLLLLQLDALRMDPALAGVLGEAVSAIRAGRDPAAPLQQARRLLYRSLGATDTLPRWSGLW